MAEGKERSAAVSGFPLRSVFVALITVQSGVALTYDVSSIMAANPDVFGTIIDGGFFGYGTKLLLEQAGVLRQETATTMLAGLECGATLSIGREPGTWMPSEWAASGARLSLPMVFHFSDEQVDLGFPGEEALQGRYAKRLGCEGGSFVGAQGEAFVKADGGAWNAVPTGRDGESVIRFFIDFPEAATRNDVTLPATRVFFSCPCWDSEERCRELMGSLPDDLMEGPGGLLLRNSGGLTIKRNDVRYLYGALGDVNLILGRFSLSARADASD